MIILILVKILVLIRYNITKQVHGGLFFFLEWVIREVEGPGGLFPFKGEHLKWVHTIH